MYITASHHEWGEGGGEGGRGEGGRVYITSQSP